MKPRETTFLEPARTVFDRFSTAEMPGYARLADLLKTHRTTTYKWGKPKGSKGTGGTIPSTWHLRILQLAREENVDLPPEILVPVLEKAVA